MYPKYNYNNGKNLKDVRRFLRRNANTAEEILWQHLRRSSTGYKFRRQYSVGNVVGDFCCESLKLIIELDGWTHDGEKTKIKDERKRKFLETKGYKVIRFTNEEIFGDIGVAWERLLKICEERAVELGVNATTVATAITPTPALPLM